MLGILFNPGIANSATYTVCASGCDYSTIDAAMTAATSGDLIIVENGEYTLGDVITFKNGVQLRSREGADSTIVNAAPSKRHFSFAGGTTYSTQTRIGLNASNGITFKGGAPTSGLGGAITIGSAGSNVSGSIRISACIFDNNTAPNATGGGAIAVYANTTLADSVSIYNNEIKNSVLTNASGTPLGGGIYFNGGGSASRIQGNTIHDTTVTLTTGGFQGGGIYTISFSGILSDNEIYNCVSNLTGTGTGREGGGMYINASNTALAEFDSNIIRDNKAAYGGGLFFNGGPTNTTITSNMQAYRNSNVASSRAPILYASGSACRANLQDCLIYKNSSEGQATGLYIYGATAAGDTSKVENCTIFGNYDPTGASANPQVQYRSGTTINGELLIKNSIISHPRTNNSKNWGFFNSTAGTGTAKAKVQCSILWRNKGTINGPSSSFLTWIDSDSSNASQYNPTFCDTTSTFTIDYGSEANSGIGTCGLIGYAGCGCGNCEGDFTAPAAISNLAFSDSSFTSLTLTWTSPGDDNTTGTAASYDLRYSQNAINASNFASATQVVGEPTPSVAGTTESFEVTDLSQNTLYYFAIKTSDEVPNTSTISNVPSKRPKLNNDTNPPSAILSITVEERLPTGVKISFTTPGDDGNTGTATSYDVRTLQGAVGSTVLLNGLNFSTGQFFPGSPVPLIAGSTQTFYVWGLDANKETSLAIKVFDELRNESAVTTVNFVTENEPSSLRRKLYEMSINNPHPRLIVTSEILDTIAAEYAVGSGLKFDQLESIFNRAPTVLANTQSSSNRISGGDLVCQTLYGLVFDDQAYLDDAEAELMYLVDNDIPINPSDDGDYWLYYLIYDWLCSTGNFTAQQKSDFVDKVVNEYVPSYVTTLANPSNRKGVFDNHEIGEAAINVIVGTACWDSSLTETQKVALEKCVRQGDDRARGVRTLSQANSPGYYGGQLDSKDKYFFDGGYYKGMQYGGKDLYYTAYYLEAMKSLGFGDYYYSYDYYNRIPEYFWFHIRPDGLSSRLTSSDSFSGIDIRWYEGLSLLLNHWYNQPFYQKEFDLAAYAMNQRDWSEVSSAAGSLGLLGATWRPRDPSVTNPLTNYLNTYKYYGNDIEYNQSWASRAIIRDSWNIKTENNTNWLAQTDNDFYLQFQVTDYFGDYRNFNGLPIEIFFNGPLVTKNGQYQGSAYFGAHYNMGASCSTPVVLDTTVVSTFSNKNMSRSDWWGFDYLYTYSTESTLGPGKPDNIGQITNGSEYDQADMNKFNLLDHPNSSENAYLMEASLNKESSYYYSNAQRDLKTMDREIFVFDHYVVVRDSMRIGSASNGELLKVLTQTKSDCTMDGSLNSDQFVKLYSKLYRRTTGADGVFGGSGVNADSYQLLTSSNAHVTAINIADPGDTLAFSYDAATELWSRKWTGTEASYVIWERTGIDSVARVPARGDGITSDLQHFPQFKNYIPVYNRGRFSSVPGDTYNGVTYTGKLTVDPLLPSNMTLRKVSGIAYAGWLDDGRGQGTPIVYGGSATTAGLPDSAAYHNHVEVGQCRVEATAAGGTTAEEFLHVYFAGLNEGTYAQTTMQECATIDVSTSGGTPLCVGVEVDSTFIWVKSKLEIDDLTSRVVFYFNGTETLPVYVTGLRASDEYSVRKKSADPASAQNIFTNGDGNLMFQLSGTADSIYVYIKADDAPQLGACCATDGTCTISGESVCTTALGTWQGANTECIPNPCPQPATGACCLDDGSCYLDSNSSCTTGGGAYEGHGTSCNPNPCPQPDPTGACCIGSSCTITTQNECAGTWQGNETTCSPNPCSTATGACCVGSGTCVIRTQAVCEGQGNTYQGDGTTCSPNPCPTPSGACCDTSDGSCTITERADCVGEFQQHTSGVTTCSPNPCPVYGACCSTNGDCLLVTEENCTTLNGTYYGDGESCIGRSCDITINPGQDWNGIIRIVGSNRSGYNKVLSK